MSLNTDVPSSPSLEVFNEYLLHENQQAAKPLIGSEDPSQSHDKRKLLKVLYLGSGFFMLFTGFLSSTSFSSQIYLQFGYASLGKLTNLILSLVFFVSLFVVPGIIKNWSYKLGVFIGSIGYFFSLLAGILTTSCSSRDSHFWCSIGSIYSINLICAAIAGLGSPILWVSATRYVTGCANESNKGTYLGIFSSFYAGAQLTSSLLAAFVIKYLGQLNFYIFATGFVLVAIIMFFFAPNVDKYDEGVEESIFQKTNKMVKLAISPRMRIFLPYCLCLGLMMAFIASYEFQIVDNAIPNDTNTEQDYITSLVYICQSIIGLLGSYGAGRLADIISLKKVLSSFLGLTIISLALASASFMTGSLSLCYLMGVFLGAGYNGVFALVNVVMAKDFEGTAESFALAQATAILGTLIGLGLSIVLTDYVMTFLIIIMVFLILDQISVFFYRSISSK